MALGKETTQGKGGWFPSIIGPNEVYARNRSGEEDVTPTPYYEERRMSKFRKSPAGSDNDNDPGDAGWRSK